MIKTLDHAMHLYNAFGSESYFGRTNVEQITGLKHSGASKLIKLLLDNKIIEPIEGHGKGKYHFGL